MAGGRHPLRIGAIAVAALVLLMVTSGWVYYADDRVPHHSARVGILEFELPEGTARGTAAVVDRCGIVTNFHVVFGPWYVTALRPPARDIQGTFTLTEVSQRGGGNPSTRATPLVWGRYLGPDRHFRRPREDWVYLVLDDCLGQRYGYFDMRSLPPEDMDLAENRFAAIGYSAGRQMIEPGCSVHAVGTAIADGPWLHDCALLGGDSGGPIIQRGTTNLVALGEGVSDSSGTDECQAAAESPAGSPLSHWDTGCANFAVPLTWPIIDRIREAEVTSGVQVSLTILGYDAGPFGALEDPRIPTAIAAFERDFGLAVTGRPSYGLLKLLRLQSGASSASGF